MPDSKETIRIAAVADLHYTKTSTGALSSLFASVNERADVLLLCGDLTDYGLPEEARNLARDVVTSLKVPCAAVLGNHDFETGNGAAVVDILREAGVKVLDGDSFELHGVGFAGAKGFGGGFGARTLAPWGEESIKRFVHEAIDEALKLETALAKLRTPRRVALLHYSPIAATVEGEPREIFPFLGSSRLEEPLNRFRVSAVFHGHAHHGALEGRTSAGAPVYNVALPLLRRSFRDAPPVRIIEMPVAGEPAEGAGRRATDRPEAAPVEAPVEVGVGGDPSERH